MDERIALYGGSFNPVHSGHLIVARSVAERLQLDKVILLPSARPPHKEAERLVKPSHRARMVELAIESEPIFELSDYDLTRSGPSYTIDTVRHFRDHFGTDTRLYWIIGADSLDDLCGWRQVRDLVDTCEIITAARPGWETIAWRQLHQVLSDAQMACLGQGVLDTPEIEISSSDIRHRAAEGRSIRYMVPDAVADYIEQHSLYADAPVPLAK